MVTVSNPFKPNEPMVPRNITLNTTIHNRRFCFTWLNGYQHYGKIYKLSL